MIFLLAALACDTSAPSDGLQYASFSPTAGEDPLTAGIRFATPAPQDILVVWGDVEDAADPGETQHIEAEAQAEVDAPAPLKALAQRILPEAEAVARADSEDFREDAPAAKAGTAPEARTLSAGMVELKLDPGSVVDLDAEGADTMEQAFDVNTVMRRYKGKVAFCHESAKTRYSAVYGRIDVAWTIVDGKPVDLEVLSNDTGDELLASCVMRQISAIRFAPGTSQDVSYPFVFPRG
jgi:hypothetical protein